LTLWPENIAASDKLIEICESHQKWSELCYTLKKRLNITINNKERADLYEALATIHMKQFQDNASALNFLKQALDTLEDEEAKENIRKKMTEIGLTSPTDKP